MNDEDITSLSIDAGENNPWSSDKWSWDIIPSTTSTTSTCDNTDIQEQVHELVAKNYILECKNKELTDKLNDLETEVIELIYKVKDLEQIIVKICEDYILSEDD